MPNVDNHMDELFQKAAENYPLKTGRGNFDKLLPFVAGVTAPVVAPIASTKKTKRKTALLLFAFLILGSSMITYVIYTKIGRTTSKYQKNDLSETIKTAASNTTNSLNTDHDDNTQTGIYQEGEGSVETLFQKKNNRSSTKNKLASLISPPQPFTEQLFNVADSPGFENPKQLPPVFGKEYQPDTNQEVASPVSAVEKEEESQPAERNKKEAEEKKSPPANSKKKKFRPAIYLGAVAGVELNQVKNQGMTKPGFNGGILVGVQLTRRLAVETGVQFSQKKYYSAGKHFNPKSGEMPTNMTVNSLKGTSTLIEIPVSIKVDLSKKKNGLYGKAGVSSYIMTKESNRYQAVVSGQSQEINSTYNNTKAYTAAELRIAAGYQHTLGKKLNIRIEPYLQIPLTGIGIGAMPVTSTGLQLVLTRD